MTSWCRVTAMSILLMMLSTGQQLPGEGTGEEPVNSCPLCLPGPVFYNSFLPVIPVNKPPSARHPHVDAPNAGAQPIAAPVAGLPPIAVPVPIYPHSPSSNPRVDMIIVIVIVAVIVFAILAGLFTFCLVRRRKRKRKGSSGVSRMGVSDDVETQILSSVVQQQHLGPHVSGLTLIPSSPYTGARRFSLEELQTATSNFNDSRLLGRGGFGYVYKGILPDGSEVAVKRIANYSLQGKKEFEAEIATIENLRHRNVVKLKGWCYGESSYLLVYEYMANGSLDALLFDNEMCAKLTWRRRWSIALGLGSALRYLHEECDCVIIHRDVKSSNVLLDDRFNAKLGDFGLSRVVDAGSTSHTTALAGTRGYMGPELFIGAGKATRESDVYAFGAVLLEIVTGKSVIDPSLLTSHQGMLLHWVWDMLGQGKLLDVVDKRWEYAESSVSLEEAKKVLIVALACSHPDPKARPSICRAMEALDGDASLPWVPTSRPLPSYGYRPSMRIVDAYDSDAHDSQSTNRTVPSSAGTNHFSGSSPTPILQHDA